MSYKFDHKWANERERLQRLERGMDPGTIQVLETIGLQEDWNCLEVGGGAGSIAAWLAAKVGPEGNVMATDLQTDFLEDLNVPGLSVRRHDIVADPLEENYYDLIHSRAVLEHLPDRENALDKLVAALKPGGWLVLEAHDFISLQHITGGDPKVFDSAVAGLLSVMSSAGFNADYGRYIGQALSSRGLMAVNTAGRAYELGGDRPLTGALSLALMRLADPICAAGYIGRDALDTLINNLQDGTVLAMSPMVVAAWGQKSQGHKAIDSNN